MSAEYDIPQDIIDRSAKTDIISYNPHLEEQALEEYSHESTHSQLIAWPRKERYYCSNLKANIDKFFHPGQSVGWATSLSLHDTCTNTSVGTNKTISSNGALIDVCNNGEAVVVESSLSTDFDGEGNAATDNTSVSFVTLFVSVVAVLAGCGL